VMAGILRRKAAIKITGVMISRKSQKW